jgi:hypothetical protein
MILQSVSPFKGYIWDGQSYPKQARFCPNDSISEIVNRTQGRKVFVHKICQEDNGGALLNTVC